MHEYPFAQCALVHNNAWELLVATILSAQCTDKRVNMVTPELFGKFPTPEAMAKADISEIKTIIRSTGFYNNKAKNILGAAKMITEKYHGEVPSSMEELLMIPGVARKTANVVLSIWFKINQGVVVDTHVGRLSRRLALTQETNPEKIEADLQKLYKRKDWERIATLLIYHGRNVCFARKPNCSGCKLNKICPAAFKD